MSHTAWLAPQIAGRYLWSKKKHGAVGVITWISVVGVAVATAATLCVLSVFNGFQDVLEDKLEMLSPDVAITSRQGRSFKVDTQQLDTLSRIPEVAAVCPTVVDRALLIYRGQEMPAILLGVEVEDFRKNSALDSLIIAGDASFPSVSVARNNDEDTASESMEEEFSEESILEKELGEYFIESMVVSVGVSSRLGIPETGAEPITVIVPRREGTVNVANPSTSLQIDELAISGIYQSLQSDYDKDYVIAPLSSARKLLDIPDDAVSALYVYASPGTSSTVLANTLRKILPKDSYVVKDRLQQHESQFRMSNIEKWITYLLLAFILVIASFNLISSLAMLVIDKQENLGVMHSMGLTRREVGNVFAWESGFVTLAGGVAGVILGIILVLMQQHWGLIKLNGGADTLIMQSYPVKFVWSDLIAVAAPLVVIGFITAFLTARFARTRIEKN